MKPWSRGTTAFAVLLVMVSLPRDAIGWVSDPWLTTKVKVPLFTTTDLDSGDVNVDTLDGRVSLHGKVPSAADKAKAVEVARSIDGVSDVRDLLQVIAPGRRVSVKATDASVAERVSKALDEDVKRGGSRASEEDARAVPGVRGVKNELQVVPEARRVAVAAKDAELQEKVSEAIYARPELKRASIHVAVRNGVVRLTGTVPSQQHRLAAAIAARRVPGMRAVGEDLQVTSITEAEAPAPADGPAAP